MSPRASMDGDHPDDCPCAYCAKAKGEVGVVEAVRRAIADEMASSTGERIARAAVAASVPYWVAPEAHEAVVASATARAALGERARISDEVRDRDWSSVSTTMIGPCTNELSATGRCVTHGSPWIESAGYCDRWLEHYSIVEGAAVYIAARIARREWAT